MKKWIARLCVGLALLTLVACNSDRSKPNVSPDPKAKLQTPPAPPPIPKGGPPKDSPAK
jgi:hypothetical protein